MYELGAVIFQSYVSMLYIRIDICHLCLASIQNFAMADFEENVEEMVRTTREAAGGDRVRRGRDRDETGGPSVPGTRPAATAGDERDGGDRWGNVCGRRSVYN